MSFLTNIAVIRLGQQQGQSCVVTKPEMITFLLSTLRSILASFDKLFWFWEPQICCQPGLAKKKAQIDPLYTVSPAPTSWSIVGDHRALKRFIF